jgi:hypothetical protein
MTDAERKESTKCRVDVGPSTMSTSPGTQHAIDASYLLAPFNSARSATARTRGTFSPKLSCARVATKSGSVLPLVESVLSPMYLKECYKAFSAEMCLASYAYVSVLSRW